MGCVYFILAGDTAKVGGEPGRDLLGQWAQAWPSFLLWPVSTLWCMSFMQLPFSQVEGAEAEQQGWEVQGGYPVILSRQAGGYPQMSACATFR